MPKARLSSGFALVFIGGTLGTLSRYGVGALIEPGGLFPVATFIVNVTGSFALGALLAALLVRDGQPGGHRSARLLVGTGILGGYTTYSALAVQTDALLRSDHVALAVGYGAGTVLAGLLAAFAGIAAGIAAGRAVAR